MALNPENPPLWDLFDDYPDHFEIELFDSVVCEKTDISGFPILYYIKINYEDSDYLYGEDPTEQFSDGYRTKLMYEPSEEVQVLSVLGMTSDDTLQYTQTPKTIFDRDVRTNFNTDSPTATEEIPKSGDVIKTLWNNKTYEIVEVGAEQNIFQASKLIWEFILRPYRHSEESDSADDVLFYEPDDEDFPDINTDTTTDELSAYGDNKDIRDDADDISPDPDSGVYGY